MVGDVNDPLDYHLWALALTMGLRYKPRPMHTSGGYDASSFYSLRKIGEIMAAPAGSQPATTKRYAQVKMLLRPAMHQMCEAFDILVPGGSDAQSGIALAILEDRLYRRRHRRPAPSGALLVMVLVGTQGFHLHAWLSCEASRHTRSLPRPRRRRPRQHRRLL